jgi:threonine synthase
LKRKIIKYYSTNLRSPEVSFSEALLRGLAPDGGLYLPSFLPLISPKELAGFPCREYHEIAYNILYKIIGNEIDKEELARLCAEAYDFEVPLEKVYDRIRVRQPHSKILLPV